MTSTRTCSRIVRQLSLKLDQEENEKDEDVSLTSDYYPARRAFLATATALLGSCALVQPSFAGEVGARINRAVTTSDLGISVRRSVVRGAQMMDKLDGQWEKFSDDNGLGSERFKQQGRPKPREVPDPKPLNVGMAKQLLQLSDDSFIELTGVSTGSLSAQIEKVDGLVRKSFERSGLNLTGEMAAKEFNYYCYIHFKAYCDIIVDNKVPFNRKQFEGILG